MGGAGWAPGMPGARVPPHLLWHNPAGGLTFRVTQQSGTFCSRYTSMMRSPAWESCGDSGWHWCNVGGGAQHIPPSLGLEMVSWEGGDAYPLGRSLKVMGTAEVRGGTSFPKCGYRTVGTQGGQLGVSPSSSQYPSPEVPDVVGINKHIPSTWVSFQVVIRLFSRSIWDT